MRLLVLSNMEHYASADGLASPWASAVGEIDALATLAREVRHVCALHPGVPPPGAAAYRAANVRTIPVRATGGRGWRHKLRVAAEIPAYARIISPQLSWADAVHVRAPASVAAVALTMLALRRDPTRRWIKYAGEWNGSPGEPFSYRLQRAALRWNIGRGKVGVCEPDAEDGKRLWVPNPSLSLADVEQAARRTQAKRLGVGPLEIVMAGRLDANKGADRALKILSCLRDRGVNAVLRIAGAGAQMERLGELAIDHRVETRTIFHGWLDQERLARLFERAHVIVAPSKTEGWPKVLSEAMAYRVVPLASAVGAIPGTLARAGAGAALPWDAPSEWAARIAGWAADPGEWRRQADLAQDAARTFTYESYLERARAILGCSAEAQARAAVFAGDAG